MTPKEKADELRGIYHVIITGYQYIPEKPEHPLAWGRAGDCALIAVGEILGLKHVEQIYRGHSPETCVNEKIYWQEVKQHLQPPQL